MRTRIFSAVDCPVCWHEQHNTVRNKEAMAKCWRMSVVPPNRGVSRLLSVLLDIDWSRGKVGFASFSWGSSNHWRGVSSKRNSECGRAGDLGCGVRWMANCFRGQVEGVSPIHGARGATRLTWGEEAGTHKLRKGGDMDFTNGDVVGWSGGRARRGSARVDRLIQAVLRHYSAEGSR